MAMMNVDGGRRVCMFGELEEMAPTTVKDYLMAEEIEEREMRCSNAPTIGCGKGDGDREETATATVQCLKPGKIVARLLRMLRRRKDGTARRSEGVVDGEGKSQAECSTNWCREEASMSLGAEKPKESGVSDLDRVKVSGQQEQITSAKLGAGLGLALVMAVSKHELDKMVELRKQMEMIVADAKEELRSKAAIRDGSRSFQNPTCSTTNIYESMNSNGRASDPSCMGSRSSPCIEIDDKDSPFIEIDDKEWSRGQCDEERCMFDGIAQLESELEAELQLLELHLDLEAISRDNQDIVQESSDGGCETLSHDEEGFDANDPVDAFDEVHYNGVPPQELERRLHELLEAQQLERIKELEAALKRTKQKLRKKEVEVCWWKDTAHLISQHVSKITPLYISPQKNKPQEN